VGARPELKACDLLLRHQPESDMIAPVALTYVIFSKPLAWMVLRVDRPITCGGPKPGSGHATC
jgi:hypothetical protein